MNERIDHAGKALAKVKEALYDADTQQAIRAEFDYREAQVHATLAVAEQLRLANVISLMQMQYEVDDTTESMSATAMDALMEPDPFGVIGKMRPNIREALGL